MAHFQRVLEGESYVTASLVPIAVFQIRKGYQETIDNEHTLEEVEALTKILLADFDRRYHPASNGMLGYSNVAVVGFGNRYTTVHHYFFVAAFLDPRTKSLLREMMTDQDYTQLKSDIVNLMITEASREKQIRKQNAKRDTKQVRAGTGDRTMPTAASRRMARMFHGLNTTFIGQAMDEDDDEDQEKLVRNICFAEFDRFKHNSVSIALHNPDGTFNDPLVWWKKNATKFPLLATLAREYLAIPATSAPSERIWSRAARILSLSRASLKPEVAQRIMFVKENLGILHKHFKTLATAERDEEQQFMVEYEKKYLPPLEEDSNAGKIDVGQDDE